MWMKASTPTIESLLEIIALQAAQIKRLEARIKELEQRLNKNSSNSSNPRRVMGLRNLRQARSEKKGRHKSGGQDGPFV